LAAHGLNDTVGAYQGIGKGVALKVIKMGKYPLTYLGDTDKSLLDVTTQCTSFMLACNNILVSKVSCSTARTPKLKTLPPTNEAFKENVTHAHLQDALWKTALESTAPTFYPTDYGSLSQTTVAMLHWLQQNSLS
jgi:hypothetical protein